MAYLEVENLCKRFGRTEVLCDFSFCMEKGEVVSIIGGSGNGKTTLLRCLNALEVPDSGRIVLDGKCLFDGKTPAAKRKKEEGEISFGLVFQNFQLFPQYTVKGNLTLAPRLALRRTKRRFFADARAEGKSFWGAMAEARARAEQEKEKIDGEADRLLAQVGLSDKADCYPFSLSGGQQQRAAIARALAKRPAVLCFDEPTSALDPALSGEVMRVIRLLKADGLSMIVVTHEMSLAAAVSDRVFFMQGGRVEEQGPPERLFSAPASEALKQFLSGAESGLSSSSPASSDQP